MLRKKNYKAIKAKKCIKKQENASCKLKAKRKMTRPNIKEKKKKKELKEPKNTKNNGEVIVKAIK